MSKSRNQPELSLTECENIVRNESQNYVKIGYALSMIKLYELYKDCGNCKSFAQYVMQRFGYSLRWATRHIEQMTVVALIFDLKTPEDFLEKTEYFKDAYISANVASEMYQHRKTKQALKDLYSNCLDYARKTQELQKTKKPSKSNFLCLRIKMNDLIEVLMQNEKSTIDICNKYEANVKNVLSLLDKVEKSLDKINTCGVIEFTRLWIRIMRDMVSINSTIEISDEMKKTFVESIESLMMEGKQE